MAATNTKTTRSHVFSEERLAGGFGPRSAKQDSEAQLRRVVMSCLLWENVAYTKGSDVSKQISDLIPLVDPDVVSRMAVEARFEQKLRHVPLFICREMSKHKTHSHLVASTLSKVIHRPDELCEFLAIYWQDNASVGKKAKTLSSQVKKGLATAFQKFGEYQLAKWDRDGKEVRLRDVIRLCHPKPKDSAQSDLWKRLIAGELKTPDTWEVGLSAAKTDSDKRAVWCNLIDSGKLGSFALLKNLRNMQQVGVPKKDILKALSEASTGMLLPLDFLKAVKYAPDYTREIESLMLRNAQEFPKLNGWTIMVVDVSGSMRQMLSRKSEFTRIDAAASMAVLASEMCEHVSVYATAGNDSSRLHKTVKIPPLRGFAMSEKIIDSASRLGGGGLFTRQCLEFINGREPGVPDRIIVFSDSQDCDHVSKRTPNPFGTYNYIIDVSSEKNGINYDGKWTAEISGWSEHFLRYIAEYERSMN